MLGGCRSSLETSVQHDGWHALADTLGHLIFLSEFFRTILEIHPFQKRKKKQNTAVRTAVVCIVFEKCCSPILWKLGWIELGKWWGLSKEMLLYCQFLVVIFGRDLQMGARGRNQNVISWELQLNRKKSNVPGKESDDVSPRDLIHFFGKRVLLLKIFFFFKVYFH